MNLVLAQGASLAAICATLLGILGIIRSYRTARRNAITALADRERRIADAKYAEGRASRDDEVRHLQAEVHRLEDERNQARTDAREWEGRYYSNQGRGV